MGWASKLSYVIRESSSATISNRFDPSGLVRSTRAFAEKFCTVKTPLCFWLNASVRSVFTTAFYNVISMCFPLDKVWT